jgi:hypothetical protein
MFDLLLRGLFALRAALSFALMRAETFASLASTYGLRVQDYPQGLGNRDLIFKNGALNLSYHLSC